ncbi:MAG: site-specific tyrosine recombinase XerC [Rhodoferax sp.]|nr:site-specific tyrosine recombinase XerC [Rhodoferax sp.]
MLRPKRLIAARPASAPDPSAANPLRAWQRAFCDYTLTRGLSEATARLRERALNDFIRWGDERGLRHPAEVTRPVLQRYQRHLYLYRKANGQPLAHTTQITMLFPLVAFFKWLTREGHILSNPAADLDLPKPPRQLPRHLLSVAEVEQVINRPDTHTLSGVRDRAMLEVLYSSGIRRGEMVRLKLYEIDVERGTLMVRLGKGHKDRLVPLGERACAWVRRYCLEVRPELLAGDTDVMFLTDYGEPFEKGRLSELVANYLRGAGIAHGACHALRHACATHMLEGGADIRYIQAILGHSELSTTQIYTHVAIAKLQAVHALTHPARLERVQRAKTGDDIPTPAPDVIDATAALLEVLAMEDDDGQARVAPNHQAGTAG